MAAGEWAADYFGSLYEEIYRRHLLPASRSRAEASFAVESLQLRNKRVLDIACGFGRHLRYLVPQAHVVGLDTNAKYLGRARELLPRRKLSKPQFVQADMRQLPFRAGSFDAVLLLFNSFGYFTKPDSAATEPQRRQLWKLPQVFYERQLVGNDFGLPRAATSTHTVADPGEDENRYVPQEIARVLNEHGQALIEVPNPAPLIAAVRQAPRRRVATSAYEIEEEFWYDARASMLHNRTRFRKGKIEETAGYDLRLYKPAEIRKMVREAGFRVLKQYGDYQGMTFTNREDFLLLQLIKQH